LTRSLRSYTYHLLKRYGIKAYKKKGQCFLVDEDVLDKIVTEAQVGKDDVVLEIGAGIGFLTRKIAQKVKKVYAIEYDTRFFKILQGQILDLENVEAVQEDILKLDLRSLFFNQTGIKVVSNLPYYISTPILNHLLNNREKFSEIIIMLQKEVGERITASCGTKSYGFLTVVVSYYTIPQILFEVKNQSFFPQPKVDSVVVKLRVLNKPTIFVEDESFFFRLVKLAFSQRRKMLINALKGLNLDKKILQDALERLLIDPRRRGETLSLEEFAQLANLLSKNLIGG
jgi:16S rRNA (adenine1518-N6/adenine1519-N6)-dimethyltransferase